MGFIVSGTQFIWVLRRFCARLETTPAQLEWDFIARSGILVNYVLVTCLLGLISVFAQLIFLQPVGFSNPSCRVVKQGQGGPLFKHWRSLAAAPYWSMALTHMCAGVLYLRLPGWHVFSASCFLMWRQPCSNFTLKLIMRSIFFAFKEGYLPRHCCLCLCLHVTAHVLVWGSFVCARACFTLLHDNLMNRFLPISVLFKPGFEGIAFGSNNSYGIKEIP